MKVETHVGLAGAVLAQAMQVFSSEYVVLTLMPAVVGAALHTVNRARKEDLSLLDIFLAALAAVTIGLWGGPWLADMAPKSETALPIMCYVAAYYSPAITQLIKHMIEERLGKDVE